MTSKTPATAEEIATLYGVHKTTVYRWVEANAFDAAPTVIASPSRERDRLLFDRAAVAVQFEKEMLDPADLIPDESRAVRLKHLEAFRAG